MLALSGSLGRVNRNGSEDMITGTCILHRPESWQKSNACGLSIKLKWLETTRESSSSMICELSVALAHRANLYWLMCHEKRRSPWALEMCRTRTGLPWSPAARSSHPPTACAGTLSSRSPPSQGRQDRWGRLMPNWHSDDACTVTVVFKRKQCTVPSSQWLWCPGT